MKEEWRGEQKGVRGEEGRRAGEREGFSWNILCDNVINKTIPAPCA